VSFSDLLARRVRTDGARPLFTCYDATGGRTELSAITYANWVAKASNLLAEIADPGDRVGMPLLRRHPGHWMGLVWVGAAWTLGCLVAPDASADDRVTVSGPDLDFGPATGDHQACSLHPLGLGFPAPLPAGVVDWAGEVRQEPDALLHPTAGADEAAWPGLTQREVLATTPIGDRVLLDCREEADPLAVLRAALVAPLLGGGSAVTVASGDAAAVATSERARPVALPDA